MAMTEDQNASIRAFAATNPSAEALAAAKQQYGVSDADYGYATAPNPYDGWNQHNGTNLGIDGKDRGRTQAQQLAAQQAQAENPNVVVGGGGGGYNLGMSGDPMQQKPMQQPMQQKPMQAPQGGGYQAGGYTKSPYIDQMAQGITSQMTDNLTRNQLPAIRSGAMSAGGFGGSRQGVVESNALNDMNRSLGQNLTNLYGSDYNTSQDRANSYDLGLRSSDLGFANLDANINNSNFSNQLASANFGMNAYNTMNNQTQVGIQAGTAIQNTPLDYQRYFTGSANNVGSGLASSTSSQTNQGNPYASAAGGAILGNQLQNPTQQQQYNPYTGAKL